MTGWSFFMPRDGAKESAVMADEQETTTDEVEGTTEEETDATESETDEPADHPEDEYVPPTKEEWAKHQKDLKAAQDAKKSADAQVSKLNKENTQRRLMIRNLEKANEDDAARAQREALEAAQARYKPVVAKSALLEANARTDRVGALIKLLNMDALEFDGNDEVVGLDIEVGRLRDEYPEFFVQPEPEPEPVKPAPKPAPKAAAAPKRPARDEPKSVGDLIAAQLLGK